MAGQRVQRRLAAILADWVTAVSGQTVPTLRVRLTTLRKDLLDPVSQSTRRTGARNTLITAS